MVLQLLADSVRRFPHRVAIVDGPHTLSYEELNQRIDRFAAALRARGACRGDRLAIVLDSSWEYVAALYGALRAGLVVVPLNVAAKARDLAQWILHSEARWLLADTSSRELPELLSALAGAASLIESSALHADAPALPAGEDSPIDAGSPASIMYTSGTTGAPKGVVLSHGNLGSNADAIADYLELTEDSSIVTILPFYYAYGSSVLHSHLARGARLVIERGFTFPHLVMKRVAQEKASGLAGVPSTFALLLARVKLAEYDLSALRYVTQAGGAMPPSLIQNVRMAFPAARLFIMYGQTEATSRISYLPPEFLDGKLGSVGLPIRGVEWQIRDESGNICHARTTGQLWVRGPNVMQGYWRNDEHTKKALRGGWLDTGDQGWLDEDGFLFLAGRRSDIIKVGAHRVHPQDVEDAIAQLPDVEEAAVAGVEDEILGEVIKAFVLLRPGSTLSEQQVRRHCLDCLAQYKVPRIVEFVTALPRTASGKLRRTALVNKEGIS